MQVVKVCLVSTPSHLGATTVAFSLLLTMFSAGLLAAGGEIIPYHTAGYVKNKNNIAESVCFLS